MYPPHPPSSQGPSCHPIAWTNPPKPPPGQCRMNERATTPQQHAQAARNNDRVMCHGIRAARATTRATRNTRRYNSVHTIQMIPSSGPNCSERCPTDAQSLGRSGHGSCVATPSVPVPQQRRPGVLDGPPVRVLPAWLLGSRAHARLPQAAPPIPRQGSGGGFHGGRTPQEDNGPHTLCRAPPKCSSMQSPASCPSH